MRLYYDRNSLWQAVVTLESQYVLLHVRSFLHQFTDTSCYKSGIIVLLNSFFENNILLVHVIYFSVPLSSSLVYNFYSVENNVIKQFYSRWSGSINWWVRLVDQGSIPSKIREFFFLSPLTLGSIHSTNK